MIDKSKRNNFQESFKQFREIGTKFQGLFNLATCCNNSTTSYVKIPVLHLLENVNKGQLKMVNVNFKIDQIALYECFNKIIKGLQTSFQYPALTQKHVRKV